MSCCFLSRIRCFSLLSKGRGYSSRSVANRSIGRDDFELFLERDLGDKVYGIATEQHRSKLKKAYDDIRRAINSNSDVRICAIGSFAVGSCTSKSDLDLLYVPFVKNNKGDVKRAEYRRMFETQPSFKRTQMYTCSSKLERLGIVKKAPIVLSQCNVPIIKGITRSGINFDIQFGSTECLHSTNFVRTAFQLEPRLVIVYHWLRGILDRYELFGGFNGLFTSFHIYMLVIYFAQAMNVLPVLMEAYPCLLSPEQSWKIIAHSIDTNENTVEPHPSVERSTISLIEDMINFYSSIDFTTNSLNVGTTERIQRATNKLLLIEPFHDQVNGICGVKNGAALMNKVFSKAKDAIDTGGWSRLLVK